jgi:tripartite-type tricarboxylate transporter receptor subunit TctC
VQKIARLTVFIACVLGAALAGSAAAQNYPAKPIKMVVPYTPGGFTDTVTRTVSTPLSQVLGQPIIIENKPGANSIIGADLVAKAAADGYTIGTVIAAHSANPSLYPKLQFDPMNDFSYVSLVGNSPLILFTKNDFPAKTVQEVIEYAKKNPGKVNFASSGVGAAAHLTMEYFMLTTGTKMVHVPYKGTAPALTDLIGGQIDIMFDSPAAHMPQVRAGKIRAIAVTADKRVPFAPELPTFIESGMANFVSSTWAMVVAPAKTPKPIVDRLSGEIAKIVRTAETRDKLATFGVIPVGSTPEEATTFYKAEMTKWGKIIKDANVKIDQ